MTTVFDAIIAGVRKNVAARESVVPFRAIKAQSHDCEPPRDARSALLQPGCKLIAEVKHPTPELHIHTTPLDPVRLAQAFEQSGAALIACHTEQLRFHSSLAEMAAVRHAVGVPILCRDLIVEPYQIHEARYFGADMIPLRVDTLGQAQLESLLDRVESLGMQALVEIRNPEEADRAMQAGATIIGVNSRDFQTVTQGRIAFSEIAPGLPATVVKIALSGVRYASELYEFAARGADAVVVGQPLMTGESVRSVTRSLAAAAQHPACPRR